MYDLELAFGGTTYKFRLARSEEGDTFIHDIRNLQLEEHELFQREARGLMTSRRDLRGFVQTDWSEGSAWFKPKVVSGDRVFVESTGVDTWTRPGAFKPLNNVSEVADNLARSTPIIPAADGDLIAVGRTQITDTPNYDVYEWTPASNDWVRDPTRTAGTKNDIHDLVFDGSDGFFYVLGSDGDSSANGIISRFDITAGDNNDWLTGITAAPGSALLLFDGELMLYDGNNIRSIDKSSPAFDATAITDDGQGYDLLDNGLVKSGTILEHGAIKLAITTTRGIFYIKNLWVNGQPQAHLYRVEVTDAGTYIRRPHGTFPNGFLAYALGWYLGTPVILGTFDWSRLLDNTNHVRAELWLMDGTDPVPVGTFLGEAPDETPATFLGVNHRRLLIGSHLSVWVYDGQNGGLHRRHRSSAGLSQASLVNMGRTTNSSGKYINLLHGWGNTWSWQDSLNQTAPKTVASFDPDNNQEYKLDSGYVDFGIDMEEKTLASIELRYDLGTANQQWTVYVEVDDGAWAQLATFGGADGGSPQLVDLAGLTDSVNRGTRFRFRIVYETKDSTALNFYSMRVRATSGETQEKMFLSLDGSAIANVENEKVDPDDVYDDLVSLARTRDIVTVTDLFGKKEATAQSAIQYRVDRCQVRKSDQGEAMYDLELTKVDF